jgi:carotenoid cleavage dioxygenase-like enzyme
MSTSKRLSRLDLRDSRSRSPRASHISGTTNKGYITSDEVAMNFPVINDKFIGIRNKYGYAQVVDSLATSKTGNFFAAAFLK